MKYTLETHGWTVDASCHSLTDEQVSKIQEIMTENGYDELWEMRNEIEENLDINIFEPNMFQVSKGIHNNSLYFYVKDEEGNVKTKMIYEDASKKEFMNLVFGRWEYFADTKSLTKATFSLDIPSKAIKILTYKNDIVLDPFMGSGTSAVAAETLGRKWIGIELSENYANISRERIKPFVALNRQLKLDL